MPETDELPGSGQRATATRPRRRARANAVVSRDELIERARTRPGHLGPGDVAELQQMLGNAATADLLGPATDPVQGADPAEAADPVQAVAAPVNAATAPATDVSSREFFLQAMNNANVRKILDNVPSTGMGKFDAEYVPSTGQLNITVKIHFSFTDGWNDDAAKQDFQTKFIAEVQASWSGATTFTCTKQGFDDLVATPVVRVAPVGSASESHYTVSVDPGPGRAMVGRQGSNPGQTSHAMFFGPDVDRAAHKSANINCSIATHEARRMEQVLADHGTTSVAFDKGRPGIKDPGTLDDIAEALLADKLPGAPKIPLTATGLEEGRIALLSKRSTVEKDRARAVANHLKGKMPGYDVKEISHQEAAKEAVTAAKSLVDQRKASLKEKGMGPDFRARREADLVKKQATLDAAKADARKQQGVEHRKVEIGIDRDFERSYTEDAYSVAVHEFGHMLGNPDEYFNYGQRTLDRRVAQLVGSGDPRKVAEGQRLQAKDQANKVTKLSDSDAERHDIQDSYAMLVESAGLEIPEFGSTNSSLMSAGTDLLPRHFVAMWEALGRITDPTVPQNEWRIS